MKCRQRQRNKPTALNEHRERQAADRKNAMSEEDIPLHESDIADIAAYLDAYTAPEPPAGSTAALVSAVEKEMDRLYGRAAVLIAKHRLSISDIWYALKAQIHFYPIYIWAAALVILLAGSSITRNMPGAEADFMVAMVPWLGSGLTLYGLYQRRGVWGDLERISPVSAEVAVLGRWLAAICLDAAAAIIASAVSVAAGWEDSFAMLTLSWLIPLLLSAALALALTLRFGIATAFGASTALWAAQLVLKEELGPLYLLGRPDTVFWAASRWIGLAAASVLALWSVAMLRCQNGGKRCASI